MSNFISQMLGNKSYVNSTPEGDVTQVISNSVSGVSAPTNSTPSGNPSYAYLNANINDIPEGELATILANEIAKIEANPSEYSANKVKFGSDDVPLSGPDLNISELESRMNKIPSGNASHIVSNQDSKSSGDLSEVEYTEDLRELVDGTKVAYDASSAKAYLESYAENVETPRKALVNTSNLAHSLVQNLSSVGGMASQLSTAMTTVFGDSVSGLTSALDIVGGYSSSAQVINKWTDSTNPIWLAWYAFNNRLVAGIVGNVGLTGPRISSDLETYIRLYKAELNRLSRDLNNQSKLKTYTDEDGTNVDNSRISRSLDEYINNTSGLNSSGDIKDLNDLKSSINFIPPKDFSGSREFIEGNILSNIDLRSDYYWNVSVASASDKLPDFPYTTNVSYLKSGSSNQTSFRILPAISLSFNDISVGETLTMSLPRSFGKVSLPANIKYPSRVTISLYDTSYNLITEWWKQYLKVTVGNPRNVLPIKDRCYLIKVTVFSPALIQIYERQYAVIPNIDNADFISGAKSEVRSSQIEFSILGATYAKLPENINYWLA